MAVPEQDLLQALRLTTTVVAAARNVQHSLQFSSSHFFSTTSTSMQCHTCLCCLSLSSEQWSTQERNCTCSDESQSSHIIEGYLYREVALQEGVP